MSKNLNLIAERMHNFVSGRVASFSPWIPLYDIFLAVHIQSFEIDSCSALVPVCFLEISVEKFLFVGVFFLGCGATKIHVRLATDMGKVIGR